ncbi:recombinase family protein [Georgenia thermotolerans]|uniref:Serine recombinase n=1 Tax=Georgenia thermotolerans TaxID=527326 RepID=A0A7J5UQK1_9MICO|nr:recombinase family protein [Georgenia thermotolerans]KAE8764686.1 serine recombinase [Georgenia thermotolerans]
MDLAFLGRVSTEDAQDPEASRMWQLARARDLVGPLGHRIVVEFFDVGQSRSLPWKRRPEASALLEEIKRPDRRFDGIVIGEPQRAFYGHQFAMTFPVLTYYGCALFVPEVGGRVDPDSEAHEIMMGLFGGMSKGERSRIQKRTRTAMHELAARTDRRLGGRPPYGYMLADAGPHPNPSRAATGQRRHKLVPDPVTAPVVVKIFEWGAAGDGLRAIAQRLTDQGAPSPSAHDRRRNPHRDPRGWSHATVRTILTNPVYTGYRYWGKQEKFEQLLDVEDVAAGNVTRMRWRDRSEWIRPAGPTHEAIIDPVLWETVAGRFQAAARQGASPGSGRYVPRRPRNAQRIYPLAGRVVCAYCDHRLSGNFNRSTAKDRTDGRVLYRCEFDKRFAVPADLADHPPVTLRQDAIFAALDADLAEVFSDPRALAAALLAEDRTSAEQRSLHERRRRLQEEIENLVGFIAKGTASDAIAAALAAKEAELAQTKQRLTEIARPRKKVDPGEIVAALELIGGAVGALAQATDAERRDLYNALDLRIRYDATKKRAHYTVSPLLSATRVDSRVRRGT